VVEKMPNPLQLSLVNFKKGSYIIVEGKQNADHFYIIRSGKVRVYKELEIVDEEGSKMLGPGDFFGVISTMSSHNHIETAMALTDVSLISVHKEQYGLLIEKNAPVAMKIIMSFSQKMRYLDEALTRITFKNTATEDLSHLFKVAEYYARQNQYNIAYYAYYRYIQHCPNGENINLAKERMAKIHPYAKAAHLDPNPGDFNRQYPKDTIICSEAEPGKELFIIQKGSVKISKIVDDNEVMLALLKAGDIFGEMALLENMPRSASAIALEDVMVLVVNKDNFQRMVATQAQLISKLTTLLSERLWFIYKQLANSLITDPLGKMYDALCLHLEKNRVPINQGEGFTFDFGPKELITMVGLPVNQGNAVSRQLFENKKIRVVNGKINVIEVDEIQRQAEYFKKMEKIERSRRQGSLQNR
jgi:CRP-like cAMP-binding protein